MKGEQSYVNFPSAKTLILALLNSKLQSGTVREIKHGNKRPSNIVVVSLFSVKVFL